MFSIFDIRDVLEILEHGCDWRELIHFSYNIAKALSQFKRSFGVCCKIPSGKVIEPSVHNVSAVYRHPRGQIVYMAQFQPPIWLWLCFGLIHWCMSGSESATSPAQYLAESKDSLHSNIVLVWIDIIVLFRFGFFLLLFSSLCCLLFVFFRLSLCLCFGSCGKSTLRGGRLRVGLVNEII